ncbi:hypothetical protein QTO34_003548 [Cnephaeus nilssonii]|uniref:Olfactory receptor n=1 Tax=Cnephaeus nilssonii TaxID=3371016 RepID=A0AA40HR22_CNENI|nr:hypothetical protein QTO34_003548 [Eptesicus nilssonii]
MLSAFVLLLSQLSEEVAQTLESHIYMVEMEAPREVACLIQILLLISLSQLSCFVHRNQENQSADLTFILLGFSEYPELQVPLFLLFLAIYIVTVLGNLGMIMVININPKLHTPIRYTQTIRKLGCGRQNHLLHSCITQFFFACIFVVTETFMLAVMAYDRFVAVCNPLLYTVVMSQKLCSLLVGASYSWGIACSLTLTYFLLELSFRGNNIINNFVCEHAPIVSVSCSDPYISQKIILVTATFNEISSLMIILLHMFSFLSQS